MQILKVQVFPILLYVYEIWNCTIADMKKACVAFNYSVRRIFWVQKTCTCQTASTFFWFIAL